MKPKIRLLLPILLAISISSLVINLTHLSIGGTALAKTANMVNQQTATASFTIFLPAIQNSSAQGQPVSSADWPMVAANPQRTSWTPEEVSGNLHVEWYRPIEAYIPQNSQIIASNGLLYVSTARGLYALHADTGELAWRFDTELPLGNSPSVSHGVVYVGGYDHKLHALNAITGVPLWAFEGAKAGYDTNPLIVDGRVFAGNRDGNMYAIGAYGTTHQGQLLWKFKTGGPIHLSAAYKDGVIYFASDDNYAYALKADTGALVWKSGKLPGDGYHSYWPVIFQDKVIFSAAVGYRFSLDPGTKSVIDSNGNPYDTYHSMQIDDLFPDNPDGTIVGPTVENQDWAHGYTVIDASRITEYLEENPQPDPHKHKPWRRISIVLNINNGSEYTFDSDHDGYGEFMPVMFWGTASGNSYPPIVGPDNILYQNNVYEGKFGRVLGWKLGTPYLSVLQGLGAIAEPQAISIGGNLIYRSICCDRVGDYFDIRKDGIPARSLWSYNLSTLAPGYNDMWTILPGLPNYVGWYKGDSDSINGIYHNHGDQNPIVPYNGRLYIHRSNAIIAFGPGPEIGKLPLLRIITTKDNFQNPTLGELKGRLEEEIRKILDAGHLRPGYYNMGQFQYTQLADYFDNPGDTLYTLAEAYDYLSPDLQQRTKAYLQNEFDTFFDPNMYTSIGWDTGAARESMPLPPEVESDLKNHTPTLRSGGRWSWDYPQHNFYAMWKYAQIFPENAGRIYELAKEKIEVPVPDNLPIPTSEWFAQRPYELNAYIAGYIGFLKLQEMAGATTGEDGQLRTAVTNELNRLLQLRASTFTKDTYWIEDGWQNRALNIARNFMMLVPELGDYLNQNALTKVQEAVQEYDYVAPYWFVARYESMMNEGVMSPLYNYSAMFQAKAYILKEPREELTKYLDIPAFERGDLLYIQDLIAAIEAPSSASK